MSIQDGIKVEYQQVLLFYFTPYPKEPSDKKHSPSTARIDGVIEWRKPTLYFVFEI